MCVSVREEYFKQQRSKHTFGGRFGDTNAILAHGRVDVSTHEPPGADISSAGAWYDTTHQFSRHKGHGPLAVGVSDAVPSAMRTRAVMRYKQNYYF